MSSTKSQSTVYVPVDDIPLAERDHNRRPLISNTSTIASTLEPAKLWFIMNVVAFRAGFSVQLILRSSGVRPFTTLNLSVAVDELLSKSHARKVNVCGPSGSSGIL